MWGVALGHPPVRAESRSQLSFGVGLGNSGNSLVTMHGHLRAPSRRVAAATHVARPVEGHIETLAVQHARDLIAMLP